MFIFLCVVLIDCLRKNQIKELSFVGILLWFIFSPVSFPVMFGIIMGLYFKEESDKLRGL